MTHRKDVVTWADIMAMPLDQIPKGDPFARGRGPADPLRERAMADALAAPQLAARVRELEAERDEARAQLAAADTGAPCDGHRHCCADRRRLAEELLRVRAERDALKEKP